MDYKLQYDKLISSRLLIKDSRLKLLKSGEYFELHHIIPKCLGGEGKQRQYKHPNLVLLTSREHFIAHLLLLKIYPDNSKIISAFFRMCNRNKNNNHSARIYEDAKKKLSILLKLQNKKGKPVELTMLGKNHSNESKKDIGDSLKQYWNSPIGLLRKKNKTTEQMLSKTPIICPHCGKESRSIGNMKQHHFDNCKYKKIEVGGSSNPTRAIS